MKILVACEWSGRVRDALRRRGHDAYSCDIEPGEGEFTAYHIQDDVRKYLTESWDMMLAFPPCTYLTSVTWLHRESPQREAALAFVHELMNADIPRIAIENPAGAINTEIRPPDQIIQPWWFGDPYKKRTCLWLKNLPPLVMGDNWEHPDLCTKWVNAGSSDGYGHRNSKIRGRTFQGIADAMADQWGALNGEL